MLKSDPGFHTPGPRLFSAPQIAHYFAPGRFGVRPRQPGPPGLAESLPRKPQKRWTTFKPLVLQCEQLAPEWLLLIVEPI